MFESMKLAGALAGLMKNREAIGAAAERVKRSLDGMRAVGQSAGGAVLVTASGRMQIIEVRLSSGVAALAGSDQGRLQLEALVAEATNDALRAAQGMAQEELKREAQALGLGDLPGLERFLAG